MKRFTPVRTRVCAVVSIAAFSVLGAAERAAAQSQPPTPGAPSVGDRLFPGLGNGGYDVKHYTLRFDYATTASVQTVPAAATIQARATQSLSRFDLDFDGDSVDAVTVNGQAAQAVRQGEELVITPRFPIRSHRRFVVGVAYTSGPRPVTDPNDFNKVLAIAWFATPSGSITAAQPNRAHRIFPSNDTPADKATYTIRAETRAASTFVANGVLTRRSTHNGRTRWTYEEREPMASELIQLAFGGLSVRFRGFDRGVALRDVAPTSEIDALEPGMSRVRDHLDYMTGLVGRYPFSVYGSLFSDATFPFALEDQTLSLYPDFILKPPFTPDIYEPIMVHELAHQWFGDDVAPARWSDVWLNEGHATWYEWSYAESIGSTEGTGLNFLGHVRAAYAAGDQWRAEFGPVALPIHGADDVSKMFSPNIYDGGALVLYALRQVIGEQVFDRLERTWVTIYSGRSVTTQDFVRLASLVAHRDLRAFLNDWLYGTKTPPMPGHPDWTVDPVGAPAPAAQALSVPTARALRVR
jgi:aminopeptidase N